MKTEKNLPIQEMHCIHMLIELVRSQIHPVIQTMANNQPYQLYSKVAPFYETKQESPKRLRLTISILQYIPMFRRRYCILALPYLDPGNILDFSVEQITPHHKIGGLYRTVT